MNIAKSESHVISMIDFRSQMYNKDWANASYQLAFFKVIRKYDKLFGLISLGGNILPRRSTHARRKSCF
jgi:hypothetical protein